jgi:hypothetical protein
VFVWIYNISNPKTHTKINPKNFVAKMIKPIPNKNSPKKRIYKTSTDVTKLSRI